MTIIIAVLTLSIFLMVASGIYLELLPAERRLVPRWARGGVGLNLLVFTAGIGVLMFSGINDALAQAESAGASGEISVGLGLALIGIGLPTGLATIGAGIAVSSVGAASLAVITEKPEIFGRTLIYLGLGEGIAIYGLVVTILLLGKI
jgi:V/A-type H+-transporting ATPase subunit K